MSQNHPKTIWITGAANGFGRYLAETLYGQGHCIVATDLDSQGLQALAQGKEAQRLLTLIQDVRNAEQWQSHLSEILSDLGHLDVLINNAGVIKPGYIHQAPWESVDFHIDINLKGVIYGTKAAAEYMAQRGQGQIINIASLAGITPVAGLNLYAAAKFGVRGFTLSVAQELRAHGVWVSVVCPDLAQTGMLTTQLDYEEAVMSFSGNKPLSVAQVGQTIIKQALEKKKLEVIYPRARGILAKLSGWYPSLGMGWLAKHLSSKGRKQQAKLKQQPVG
ncbi:SDR family oxidoreductase [Eisenibacter elegans]|jgi:3-oxoacyl-[acyl-carrier protein] reductase|uniref:SDR family oxidoreductase n=1 Tax=Eisenibacter elegans TaxID=997 RepID=UPI000422EC50|nr:SDR family oxidoreductase [Eisenibacter elegans]